MTGRLATHVAVGAFIRLVEQAGGSAAVLARGDRDAGQVLLVAETRAGDVTLWEPGFAANGTRMPVPVGPAAATSAHDSAADVAAYWQRRRRSDPDLWVVEAIVAQAERFAAQTIFAD